MSYGVLRAVFDFITDPNSVADEYVVAWRREICDGCEVRNETTDICTACGCFLPAKIRMKRSECPMQLWEAVE